MDALIALKMSIGALPINPIADINEDDEITAFDAYMILQDAIKAENEEKNKEEETDLIEVIWEIAERYNKNIEIPYLKEFYANERINCEISLNDENVLIVGIGTDNIARVTEVKKGAYSVPTIRAYTTENTIHDLANSKDLSSAFQDALDRGDIKFEGVEFTKKVETEVMKIGIKYQKYIPVKQGYIPLKG